MTEFITRTSGQNEHKEDRSDLPSGRVLIGAAVAYALVFVAMMAASGSETDIKASGATLIANYDKSATTLHILGYAVVIAAAALVFFGAAMRRILQRDRRDWLADVGFAGTVVMGATLVGFIVTAFAMDYAVATGTPEVVQSINILDHENFVPAMLGLCCIYLGMGVSGLRTGSLPKWLAIVSVLLGVLSPLGPGAFVPFALLPIWVIVIAAVTARRLSSEPATA